MGGGGFNQPLDKWDVSNVEDMESMFENNKFFNQNIKHWDVTTCYSLKKYDKFADNAALINDHNPFIGVEKKLPYIIIEDNNNQQTICSIMQFGSKAEAERTKIELYFKVYKDTNGKFKCLSGKLLNNNNNINENTEIDNLIIENADDVSYSYNDTNKTLTINCKHIHFYLKPDCFNEIILNTTEDNKIYFYKEASNISINKDESVHLISKIPNISSTYDVTSDVDMDNDEIDFSQYTPIETESDSSLALALGVSVASATSCSSNNSFANYTPITDKNRGMWFGTDLETMNEALADTHLKEFYWNLSADNNTAYVPMFSGGGGGEITVLSFKFDNTATDPIAVSGNALYTITIGGDNKSFLLNADDTKHNLKTNLSIDFGNIADANYYLKAKKLGGSLTLSNGGIFKAYLAEGLNNKISIKDANAKIEITNTSTIFHLQK